MLYLKKEFVGKNIRFMCPSPPVDIKMIINGDEYYIEVKATNGDTYLGGDDFDYAIMQYLIREFKNSTRNRRFADGKVYKDGITITNKDVLRAIKTEAEKAKIALSETETTLIHVSKVIPEIDPNVDLNVKLSRDLLEYIVSDLVEKTITIALDCLEIAKTLILIPKLMAFP